jgi:hypothetical protein
MQWRAAQLRLRLGERSSASHIGVFSKRRMRAMREIDDEFEVKLGRIGNRRPRKATSYLRRVRQEATKAGGSGRAASSFTGGRIGRGRAQGAVLAGRGRSQGQRRVVIKARIVRIKSGDLGAVRAHLRYVQRDGVTREGEPGELYDASSDRADGKSFTERSTGDRHQFRFIVAPEDGAELTDLKPFVRDLMRQMEQDLGTRLDWVAADHFNTGIPIRTSSFAARMMKETTSSSHATISPMAFGRGQRSSSRESSVLKQRSRSRARFSKRSPPSGSRGLTGVSCEMLQAELLNWTRCLDGSPPGKRRGSDGCEPWRAWG